MNADATCLPAVTPTRQSAARGLLEALMTWRAHWETQREERRHWRSLQGLDDATRRDLGLPERAALAPEGRTRWLPDPWA